MIDREKLKYVINKLLEKDYNYPLASKVLEVFEENANCLADYDTLGELSIKAKHNDIRLRAAQYSYTNCTDSTQLYKARENLYKTYNALNYPEKALFYIELNLKLKPNDPETLMNKAFNLALLGDRQAAKLILENIKTKDAKQLELLEHASYYWQLKSGDTAKGIENFITKFKPENILLDKSVGMKFWDGGVFPGKTIIINGEGGIGDEIINIRFLNWFKKFNMKPILFSSFYRFRPDIVNMFRRNGFEVETSHKFFKKEYLWTHMMSLPAYMRLTEDELWDGKYLQPIRKEKNKLQDNKFKIGIKCNGNPYFDQDIYRKIPIEKILNILPENVSVYFFDKENTHPKCINLIDKLDTWEDTLDYIDQMDIIVSSCTSLVHAAGAMGKRTIVITPISEYYTWTSTRTDESTPWYGDNFSVVRQTKVRDWEEPLNRAKELIEIEMDKKYV